jgi:hypothetical protein
LQAIQLPIQDRQELLRSLKAQGFQENLVQWINSSLIPYPDNTDEFKWAFDIEGAAAMYHSYCRTDYWDLLASPPMGATVNVLRGGKSDRWDEAMIAKLDEVCAVSQAAQARVLLLAFLDTACPIAVMPSAQAVHKVFCCPMFSLQRFLHTWPDPRAASLRRLI